MLWDVIPTAVDFTTITGTAVGVGLRCDNCKDSMSTAKAKGFQISRLHSAIVHKLRPM